MNKHQSRDIVFIDIESTDVDETSATVIELGAARYTPNGDLLATYQRKIRPQSPVSLQAARVNGYSETSWIGAIPFSVALSVLNEKAFEDFPAKATIASYCMFDRNVIANQCKREGLAFPFEKIPWLNVADMTYPLVITGRVESRRLKDLASFLEIPPWTEHRAVEDAKALGACYFAYMSKISRGLLAGSIAASTLDKVGGYLKKRFALDSSQ